MIWTSMLASLWWIPVARSTFHGCGTLVCPLLVNTLVRHYMHLDVVMHACCKLCTALLHIYDMLNTTSSSNVLPAYRAVATWVSSMLVADIVLLHACHHCLCNRLPHAA